ncbi:MAG: hypothetical protein AAF749_06090 [Pseudomonadota bacterium]
MDSVLTEKQVRAITLLTAGQHGASVAKQLGVTPQTLSRWRRKPSFAASLNEHKQVVVQAAIDHMQANISKVTQELIDLALNASNEEIRRKACTDVIKFLVDDLKPFSSVEETDTELMTLIREADSYFARAEAMKRTQMGRYEVEFFESRSKS